ncbi:ABC transporter permease [Diplocloster modestus]|uniref:ABC transporter permease n=1 Tax=Diplocloster modestus TaxID=2850322 RepID=A0ABS6K7A6_9FIRM|nr:ABC transporter permease [Diplocloster modestus]MBU9726426.1 ABC transporter permease [Diplocloster modestus]
MAQLLEYLKMAIDNIRSNKGRSFLTMLGIIIGIASVIAIMSIGTGVKSQFSDELNAIAGGQVYIYVNENAEGGSSYITQEDIDAIKSKIAHVKGVSPTEGFYGSVLTGKGNFDLQITAGTADYQYVMNQELARGHYFTEEDFEDGRLVGVISQTDAIAMYGTDDVIGMTMEVTLWNITKEVTIVGVKKVENGTFVTYTYDGMPMSIEMPYTAMSAFDYYPEDTGFYSIYIVTEGNKYSSAVADEAIRMLEARHQNAGKGAYMMQDFNDQMAQINSMLDMITTFIALVAAISLLVGGIGVMNIMLVSVTERTREIGIRKALGARTGSIMLQFLAESSIITVIGGIIGILVGIGGAALIGMLSGGTIAPKTSFGTVIVATLFSTAVGLFFGIYPAKKAAKLSPIEALRRE